jgi:hypothetical protein
MPGAHRRADTIEKTRRRGGLGHRG